MICLCLQAQLSRSPADFIRSGAHSWEKVQKAAPVCDDFRVNVVRNVKNEDR